MKVQTHQHISLRDAHAVHSQCGLTLLEVLIALLVLSIGLIGAAVLTVQSLQNTHSALYTSLASAAALDLEERLWIDLGRGATACPDPNSALLNAFVTDWTAAPPNLGLPSLGLNITTNQVIANAPNPDLRQLAFDLTWLEDRFGAGNETFSYDIRVLCR